MPALSIAAAPLAAANDIEDAVIVAELDWLEQVLGEARALYPRTEEHRFDAAWARLERMAVALGMPENSADDAASWAEDYLRQHGRMVHAPAARIVGTSEYRQRHIAMLWQAQLWHEAVQVLFVAVAVGLLFYAVAAGAN